MITEVEPCRTCHGLGAVFEHFPSCRSDFCVGNGDEHSCLGTWEPCPSCEVLSDERAEDP